MVGILGQSWESTVLELQRWLWKRDAKLSCCKLNTHSKVSPAPAVRFFAFCMTRSSCLHRHFLTFTFSQEEIWSASGLKSRNNVTLFGHEFTERFYHSWLVVQFHVEEARRFQPFAPISYHWPQKSSNIHAIYHHLSDEHRAKKESTH